ncbi:MAG: hypothetical protein JOY93_00310 [Acidobacteriales bacterium]|nr:hypothetical protein [Terriglobales bacterium]
MKESNLANQGTRLRSTPYGLRVLSSSNYIKDLIAGSCRLKGNVTVIERRMPRLVPAYRRQDPSPKI